MTELESLPNIGPKLAQALRAAGITDGEALVETGSVNAWWAVHPTFDCQHSLQALEAAIQGIPKRQLDPSTRQRLRMETTDPWGNTIGLVDYLP